MGNVFDLTNDKIYEYSNNRIFIIYIKELFKRMSNLGATKLIILILKNRKFITIEDINSNWKGFYQYNMSKFDEDNKTLNDIIIKNIQNDFYNIINNGQLIINKDKLLITKIEKLIEKNEEINEIINKNNKKLIEKNKEINKELIIIKKELIENNE